jgi:hypothetical protein
LDAELLRPYAAAASDRRSDLMSIFGNAGPPAKYEHPTSAQMPLTLAKIRAGDQ